jgi:hypothetical protein
MKEPPKSNSVWTRGRFFMIVAALFALQIGLIALFGARVSASLPAPSLPTRFRAIRSVMSQEELMRFFFVSDPAVFPLPSGHGFSGRAWMNQPPAQYQAAQQLDAPLWLALDSSKLGAGSALLSETEGPAPLKFSARQNPRLEPLPVFLSPQIVPTQSVFRIEGELAKRFLGPAPLLHAWPSPSTKLLTNTVVQIAANRTGDILTARLMTRCGSPDADADALAKAWSLRFRASADGRIQWAQAVFDWQTTFPVAPGAQP